jgi:hypothetical protein
VSATVKDADEEVSAGVVHPPWNAPHGFLKPMTETLQEIQPSGGAFGTESQNFSGSRTPIFVSDAQLSESLPLEIDVAAAGVDQNADESDAGPEAECIANVALISALDIFYTFLGYLTQRQLQLVCNKFELSKCGTKEKLTRSILQRLNVILDDVVRGRKGQGQLQDQTSREFEIAHIAKRVDVVCKVPSGVPRSQHVPCTFQEFSQYCLTRTSSGPVICVKRCKLSKNSERRDVVGSSRGWPTGDFGRLIAVITTDIVARQVVESGLRLTRKQLDSKQDPDRVWSDTVLPRFQDPNFKPSVFVPLIMLQKFKNPEALDFSKVPDREMTASHLRKTFYELRGEFSKCYSRWSRSGQNDPENFSDFASCDDDGYLNSVGERCCILAAALKLGTPDECKELLNFTVRLCDSGAETDLDGNGWICYSDIASGSSSQRRKRKYSSGANSSEQSLAEQVTDCLQPVLSMFKSTMESSQTPPAWADTSLNEQRRIAMITLREAYATLEKVPQSAQDIVQGQINSILDELKRIGK